LTAACGLTTLGSDMATLIHGIQQLGIGVANAEQSFRWFRKAFGIDIPVFDDPGKPVHMLRYTGQTLQERRAILAANIQGGSAFEIWQYTSRTPTAPAFELALGDCGIFAAKIKARNIESAHATLLAAGIPPAGPIEVAPDGTRRFSVKDPWNNWYEIGPSDQWFTKGESEFGAASGCIIGVADVERSLRLYRDLLGYSTVVYDVSGSFSDFAHFPGGSSSVRRILLARPEPSCGPFGRWIGPSTLELVQNLDNAPRKAFEGRYWGDLGFIHLCFDVHGMETLKSQCAAAGFGFTVDSAESFDMGDASGRFAYIEDPDGTLIEFVEAHRIPVVKKLGLFLNLTRRNPEKPLPDWMVRLLGLGRVKE